jgi:hypothetical protein
MAATIPSRIAHVAVGLVMKANWYLSQSCFPLRTYFPGG